MNTKLFCLQVTLCNDEVHQFPNIEFDQLKATQGKIWTEGIRVELRERKGYELINPFTIKRVYAVQQEEKI